MREPQWGKMEEKRPLLLQLLRLLESRSIIASPTGCGVPKLHPMLQWRGEVSCFAVAKRGILYYALAKRGVSYDTTV